MRKINSDACFFALLIITGLLVSASTTTAIASSLSVTDLAESKTPYSHTLEFSLSGLTGDLVSADIIISEQTSVIEVSGYYTATSLIDSPPTGDVLGSFGIGETILDILSFINDLIPPPPPSPDIIEIEIIGLSLRSVDPIDLIGPSVPRVVLDPSGNANDTIIVRSPSSVPIPAAAWLFGSVLFGYLWLSRHKKA